MADNSSLGASTVTVSDRKGHFVETLGGDVLYMPEQHGSSVTFTAAELRALAAELDARIEEAARKPKPCPCPFCGSSNSEVAQIGLQWFRAICFSCGAEGPREGSKSAAASVWARVWADVEAASRMEEI
jgi:hypothetical protein